MHWQCLPRPSFPRKQIVFEKVVELPQKEGFQKVLPHKVLPQKKGFQKLLLAACPLPESAKRHQRSMTSPKSKRIGRKRLRSIMSGKRVGRKRLRTVMSGVLVFERVVLPADRGRGTKLVSPLRALHQAARPDHHRHPPRFPLNLLMFTNLKHQWLRTLSSPAAVILPLLLHPAAPLLPMLPLLFRASPAAPSLLWLQQPRRSLAQPLQARLPLPAQLHRLQPFLQLPSVRPLLRLQPFLQSPSVRPLLRRPLLRTLLPLRRTCRISV